MGENKKSDGLSEHRETTSDSRENDIAWLQSIIDLLASEYGWSKEAIEDHMYFDEAFAYSSLIADRKRSQYRMLLAIVQNPHVEKPQELWDALADNAQASSSPQKTYTSPKDDEKLDKAAFGRLAQAMSSNPRMKVNC